MDDAQPVAVMVETPVLFHALVECGFSRMAEGRMAEIVCQCNGLSQIFIQAKLASNCSADLSDFQGMSQPSAVMVIGLRYQDLCLVHQSTKGRGVNDPVAIALIESPISMAFLGMAAATTMLSSHGVGSEPII